MQSSSRTLDTEAGVAGGLQLRTLMLLMAATILAYFALYAPQPLLPLFQRRFGIGAADAALLISAALLPLSIAPLAYGALLGRLAPIKLLRVVLLLLALLELAFVLAHSFRLMLAIRFGQGLMLPAVFTAVTTHIASVTPGTQLRRMMAIYVATTIVGGYLGRLLAGLSTAIFDWRVFFVLLAAALLLCSVLLWTRHDTVPGTTQQTVAGNWLALLRNPAYWTIYLSIFCLFFVFAGLLNFLPFRTGELLDQPPEWLNGLMYSGYLLGVVTALSSGRIVARLGSDRRAILLGYSAFVLMLGTTLVPQIGLLFAVLFLFCGTMFLVHSLSSGMVNQAGNQPKGMVNGAYMTFYYSGGVLGSYLPGFAYERWGWPALVLVLLVVALAGWLLVLIRPWVLRWK
jgi:YNFM family putative membrane transporter